MDILNARKRWVCACSVIDTCAFLFLAHNICSAIMAPSPLISFSVLVRTCRNKRWKTQNSKFWYQLAPLIAVLGRVGDQNSESSLKNSLRFSSILHLVRAFLVGAPASPMASSEHICVDVALGMNGKALDIFLASSFMRSIEGATDQLSLKRKHGAV